MYFSTVETGPCTEPFAWCSLYYGFSFHTDGNTTLTKIVGNVVSTVDPHRSKFE